jgi:hypothetical protein
MPEPKTQPTRASVAAFLNAVDDPQRRKDAKALDRLLREVTGCRPVLWGESLVGYGSYAYVYPSGHSGVSFLAGFSPRKAHLVVYVMAGFADVADLMARLGKHKTGKACLYLKRLADVDVDVLRELLARSVEVMRARYPDEGATTARRKGRA